MQHTWSCAALQTSCKSSSLPSATSHFTLPTPPLQQVRAELGFPPLVIVVIGLIYSRRRAAKLSSTDLREEDAAGPGGSPRQPAR